MHAYALVAPAAVFALESAAALLGLPIFGEPRDIHLYDAGRAATRRFGDVVVHASVDPRDIEVRGGFAVTSPPHTAIDLMRVLPAPFGLAVGDAVVSPVQGGRSSVATLTGIAASGTGSRGRRLLRMLLPMIDPRSESTGESVGRAVIVWTGFELPELQVVFRSGVHKDRVDYVWPSVRAIAESDGYGKYVGETQEQTVRRIIAEKKREDRLRRHCRAFGRWDMRAALDIAPLVTELTRLGIPRTAAPRTALLTSMRTNLR